MRRFLIALAFAAYGIIPANAQEVARIDIIEYGIYSADVLHGEPGSNGVVRNNIGTARHIATATKVPAQIGVHFGFRYRIVGKPDGQAVELRKVVVYPRGGVQPPKSAQPLQTTDRRLVKVIGGTSYTDYSLDEPWELVPGKWTMQLWQGSRKLAEKSFTVTAK